MLKPTVLGLALVLLALPGSQPAAAARQLEAGKSPEVTGPLEETSRDCERETRRAEGRTLARIESCTFFFSIDPMSELNPVRDYGVAWLQMTIDSMSGSCLRYTAIKLLFDGESDIETYAPDQPLKERRPQRHGVVLETTAGGTELETGSVAQALTIHPHVLLVRPVGEVLRLQYWVDYTRGKIAAVMGAELSWNILDPLEDFEVRPGEMAFVRC